MSILIFLQLHKYAEKLLHTSNRFTLTFSFLYDNCKVAYKKRNVRFNENNNIE